MKPEVSGIHEPLTSHERAVAEAMLRVRVAKRERDLEERRRADYGEDYVRALKRAKYPYAVDPCPHDTDGDGNCGRSGCTHCGGGG